MARGKEQSLSAIEYFEQVLVPENEQPHEVPENWSWVRFGYLAADIADGPFGSNLKKEHYTDNKEVRIIQLSNIGEYGWRDDNSKYTSFEHAETISRSLVNPGEIVIAKMMPAGRAIIVPNDEKAYVLSSDAIKFVPKEFTNTKYMLYAVNSSTFRNQVTSETQGITRARTSIGKMKTYAFPLPPLAEQQRIVDRIESLFAKLDQAKELAQKALDSFETRKAAILHKAFTGVLTAKWREKHGVGINTWERKQFADICDIVRGGSPRPAGDPQYYGGDIPFLKVADITRNNSPFVTSAEYSIKETGLKKTRMVEANTLLLTNSGATLGVPAICTFPTTFNDGIAAFLNLDARSLKFMYYFWTSKTSELRGINKGAAQPNLNTDIIGSFMIDLPTLEEQQEIARLLDDLLDKEQKVEELIDVTDKIELLKKTILARALRGGLGTNDACDESALELLKEILPCH
ncbi:restriction endonuclease subunit S [Paenibacillus sp. YN15]|uniref:restriction endonuclease subunit S n=1 Tax=Paenibacillus sp. YN15 TaxID=1742774 RepID=UPI000DCD0598|nr:restriction endonuclease subunit S [Paenibacillus sp. YN15]RAV02701.1 hypothetical protein DQG13_09370 [Paenibacillus sp. YN15]